MQAEKLFVRVRNNSSQAFQNIPVKLLINDSVKAIANLTIDPTRKKISSSITPTPLGHPTRTGNFKRLPGCLRQ
jgi:hypothetical protein